jgi:hypothetical protein
LIIRPISPALEAIMDSTARDNGSQLTPPPVQPEENLKELIKEDNLKERINLELGLMTEEYMALKVEIVHNLGLGSGRPRCWQGGAGQAALFRRAVGRRGAEPPRHRAGHRRPLVVHCPGVAVREGGRHKKMNEE